MAAVDLVAIKTAFEALPFKDAVDSDALLEKVKEKRGELPEGGATSEFLRSIFKDMGIETVIEVEAPPAPEGEEGDGDAKEGGEGDAEAEAKGEGEGEGDGEGGDGEGGDGEGEDGEKEAEAPPPEPEYTNKAADLFALVDTNGSGSVNVSDLLSIVNLITKGYGEACLQYCAKAFDLEDKGSLNEEELFSAIRWSASGELTPILMTHLRRLWRQVNKDGAGGDTRANTEDFFEKLGGDEFLGAVLLTDKAVELPTPEGEGGDEEED